MLKYVIGLLVCLSLGGCHSMQEPDIYGDQPWIAADTQAEGHLYYKSFAKDSHTTLIWTNPETGRTFDATPIVERCRTALAEQGFWQPWERELNGLDSPSQVSVNTRMHIELRELNDQRYERTYGAYPQTCVIVSVDPILILWAPAPVASLSRSEVTSFDWSWIGTPQQHNWGATWLPDGFGYGTKINHPTIHWYAPDEPMHPAPVQFVDDTEVLEVDAAQFTLTRHTDHVVVHRRGG